MGFATNRVVSKGMNKTGLSAVQLKGMSKLQNICGVKKPEEKKESENENMNSALIEKLTCKGDDMKKHNKLTADFETPDQVLEKSKSSTEVFDTVSVNSTVTSDSVSTSNTSSRIVENKKPVAKKGFSLRNLI